jgi:uncharacterized protein (TIGR04141 family)
MSRQPITAYLLGRRVQSVADAEQALRELGEEIALDLGVVETTRAFVVTTPPMQPTWAPFVERAIGRNLNLPSNSSTGAVLLIEAGDLADTNRVVAFTFGVSGHHFLNRSRIEHRFGLRCALNACFPRGSPQTELVRLRSIDSKKLDEVVLDTRQLASREVDFETFGMNIRKDLLRAIEGQPVDTEAWGARVRGRDSFQLSIPSGASLPAVARKLLTLYDASDYREHFSWVDNIRPVLDDTLLPDLEAATVEAVKHSNIDLVGPEELDRRNVRYYRIKGDSKPNRRISLSLSDYVKKVGRDAVTIERLRSDWIGSYDDDGTKIDEKSVFECLTGDLSVDGETFVFADGQFYSVDRSYLAELDRDISALRAYEGLPPCPKTDDEDAYNKRAAQQPDLLIIHPRTIRLDTRTTAIEPCDLYSRQGALICVKKRERSSSLSHLFSQGAVSGELLMANDAFRTKLRAVLKAHEADRRIVDPTFVPGIYKTMLTSQPARLKHEIVFALIAKWGNTSLAKGLPFFSKVNLRQRAEELTRLGLKMSVARVRLS